MIDFMIIRDMKTLDQIGEILSGLFFLKNYLNFKFTYRLKSVKVLYCLI